MGKKRIKTRSAKNKGKRLQNWVAEMISNVTGIPQGKDELIASREMGQTGPDVRLIGEAKTKFPFVIECKNQEKWNVPAWIDHAKSHDPTQTNWMLFAKRNRFDTVVILNANTFFDVWAQYLRSLDMVVICKKKDI
jgi:hypothetical protein